METKKPRTHQTISLRLPIAVYEKLKEAADRDDRSINYKATTLLKKCLEQEPAKKDVG
jgi:hypothetical protein